MAVVFVVLTYLVAAIPFGLVITTLYGGDVDLRAAGSGNIGATNVARVYGWRLAGTVLLLDVLKGFLPVVLAQLWWPEAGIWWGGLVAGAAFIGHCFPVYLELRGGKGVATGAGAMLAIAPLPTLFAVVLWGGILALTGRSSVSALGATLGLIGLAAWLDPAVLSVAVLLAGGVAYTHVANIRRLVRGEEQEVIRPVRWGRGPGDRLSVDELLAQAPAGTSAPTAQWRERVHDPLATDEVPRPELEDGDVEHTVETPEIAVLEETDPRVFSPKR